MKGICANVEILSENEIESIRKSTLKILQNAGLRVPDYKCIGWDPFDRYETMLCSLGSPNQALLGMTSTQLGRFYGLNSGNNSSLSDTLELDFHGGFEKTISAVFKVL